MEIESIKSVGAANSGAHHLMYRLYQILQEILLKLSVIHRKQQRQQVKAIVVQTIRAKCKIRQMKTER